jgi:hypothetical protein
MAINTNQINEKKLAAKKLLEEAAKLEKDAQDFEEKNRIERAKLAGLKFEKEFSALFNKHKEEFNSKLDAIKTLTKELISLSNKTGIPFNYSEMDMDYFPTKFKKIMPKPLDGNDDYNYKEAYWDWSPNPTDLVTKLTQVSYFPDSYYTPSVWGWMNSSSNC